MEVGTTLGSIIVSQSIVGLLTLYMNGPMLKVLYFGLVKITRKNRGNGAVFTWSDPLNVVVAPSK